MNEYQEEHLAAFRAVRTYRAAIDAKGRAAIDAAIGPYLDFRRETAAFQERYFGGYCTKTCFTDNWSACCAREGIVAFFADVVINVWTSGAAGLDAIEAALQTENRGIKCIYLTPAGCLWHTKPIVCEMFLCETAETAVFKEFPEARVKWKSLWTRKEEFTWPDRPVLFDTLENIFREAGVSAPLMYFHESPGLLRVKKKAGLPLE